MDEKDPGADAAGNADQDCIGAAEYNIKRTGCPDWGNRSNDYGSDLWKKQEKGNEKINYEGIRIGGNGVRRKNEKRAEKQIVIVENQGEKTLVNKLLARLKKCYDFLKDNNGGKCEVPDCEHCPFPPCEIEE